MNAVAERDAAIAERDRLIELYEHVHHLLRKANDHRFGARNERLERLPAEQLQLALEDIEASIAKTEAIEEKREPRLPRTRKRGALPEHLPRIHETVAPPNTNCPCCNAPMHMIGEEASERLDVVPAQYRVIVTHRPKFACRACEKVVQENAPEHLIKSGLPTEAMVASVLVAKYGWHLPLYRQSKMLSMQGIDIDRSTLAFWVGYAAAELAPLYERLKECLLASSRLAVDETPVPVLDPGRGRTKTGYFWTMARDDRPFGGTDPPAVAYTYAPGRGAVHLHTLLKNYRGIVQCDGYAPYKKLPEDAITLAFCWAHCGAASSRSRGKATLPLPPKPLRASRRSMSSRRTCAAQVPRSAVPRAMAPGKIGASSLTFAMASFTQRLPAWLKARENLIITGQTGTGKTWLACAFARQAARLDHSVLYLRMPRLFENLAMARLDGRFPRLVDKLARVQLLILDDWGTHSLNDQQRLDLLEIFEERYRRKSTLIAAQLPVAQWHEMIGEPTIADAILDRIVHNAHRITLEGDSLRKRKSTPHLTDAQNSETNPT